MENKPSDTKSKNLFSRLGVPFIMAIGIAFLISQFPLHNLESYLYDLRVRISPVPKTSGQIELVTITKDSLRSLNGSPKANHYAELFNKIAADQPKAILSLIRPDDVEGDEAGIKQLVDATKGLKNFFIAGKFNNYPVIGLEEKLILTKPFDFLKVTLGSWTWDQHSYAADNVTRRMILNHSQRPTVIPVLANQLRGRPASAPFKRQFTRYFSKEVYSDHLFVDFRPTGTYPVSDFHQVIDKSNPIKKSFKDKIVIIGNDTKDRPSNYSRTPYSKDVIAMTKVETHANMLDTALLDAGKLKLPHWADIVITMIISFITLYIVLSVKPTIGLIALGVTLLIFTLSSLAFMAFAGVWVNMIHPYLAVFICYYFSIPYRLIIENRRSWEYYQKHRLLKQVEELKTNFLSMMSHDLKTPIARIQGMSEILLKEKDRLNSDQVDAVERIILSAEELSGFISTVLDLGRIENQKIKLKMQSKDVNSLLEDVVKKHEFLAKKKDIEVILDLEPLFSVKMDAELMRQVFANLIENAIKYSPAKSKVLVSSEEIEGRIQVQIADQGEGIGAEELNNVFMKFYRSKNARSSANKGSGLGLYLAKYFVDLHHGNISVESTPKMGSTFTVELPMNNANP